VLVGLAITLLNLFCVAEMILEGVLSRDESSSNFNMGKYFSEKYSLQLIDLSITIINPQLMALRYK